MSTLTSEEWQRRYSLHMQNLGIEQDFANECAQVGASCEKENLGENVECWESPEDAAADEMSYWGD